MKGYFKSSTIVSNFFDVKKINCGVRATIWSSWGVKHPMCSLCNFLKVCKLNVKRGYFIEKIIYLTQYFLY